MQRRSVALRGRAVVAVGLLLGFYLLAAAVVAALVAVNVALFRSTGRISSQLVLFSVVSAYAVLHGVFSLERRRGESSHGVDIGRADEPELWRLVDDLSRQMRTQPPQELRIVDDVNAYVGEVGGLLGLRKGRRLMAVGLGLVQVLTVDQLRAVLAHELGHYAGGDTRLGGVNYRAATSLGRTVESLGSRSLLGRLFAAYARLFFRVSSAVRRRQELTADAAAVRIGGREAHVEALRTVGAAAAVYSHFLDRFVVPLWERRLRPEDLYSGFRAVWSEPSRAGQVEELHQMLLQEAASPYDSHPSLGERIANAERVPDGGGRSDTRSARELFTDIAALERRVTRELSATAIGNSPEPGVRWDQVAAAVVAPQVSARTYEFLEVVAHVDGGRSPATLGRLLDLLESEAVLRLAVKVAGDVSDVPEQQRAEHQAQVLKNAVMTIVASALVDAGVARWELSWARELELVAEDGSPLALDEWVAPVLDEPERVPDLRRLLHDAGVDVAWIPAGPPQSPRSARAVDALEGWLNGLAYRWRMAEAFLFRDELVIAHSLRGSQERVMDACAAMQGGRSGPSRATVDRVRSLLEQPVEAIVQRHPTNRRVPWTAVRQGSVRRRPGGWLLRLELVDGDVLKLRSGISTPSRGAVVEALRPFLGDRLRP